MRTSAHRGRGRRQKGFTLLELLVVLIVVSLVITGVVSVVTVSVRNARFARDQAQASRYTQEAMEWIRQQRDSDWNTFFSRSGATYCMSSLSWSSSSPCSSGNTISSTNLVRNATMQTIDNNTVSVDVVVSWSDTSGSHQSRMATYLTNWK